MAGGSVLSGRGVGGGRCFWEPRQRRRLQGGRAPESPGKGREVWGQRPCPWARRLSGPQAQRQRAGRDSRGTPGTGGRRAGPGRCRPQLAFSRALWELPTMDNRHWNVLLLDSAVAMGTAVFSLCVSLSCRVCVSTCLSEHLRRLSVSVHVCHLSLSIVCHLSVIHLSSIYPLSVSITYQLPVSTVCLLSYHLCLSVPDFLNNSIATCGRSDASPLRATGWVT